MRDAKRRDTRSGYDAVSEEYAARFVDELEYKPFDRKLLDYWAGLLPSKGPIFDIGCGPGQITRYLWSRGARVRGLDLSPRMVARARDLHPDIEFDEGDMLSLDLEDASAVGVSAFYSIIHVPRDEVEQALREFHRVLEPGGRLLMSFHLGSGTTHLDEWMGQKVSLDFQFFSRSEMEQNLGAVGFAIDEVMERGPYPSVEAQTCRVYVLARTPR